MNQESIKLFYQHLYNTQDINVTLGTQTSVYHADNTQKIISYLEWGKETETNIYHTVNKLKPGLTFPYENKKDGKVHKRPHDNDIQEINAFFIDADNIELPDIREFKLPPSVILSRDNTHHHLYWFLISPITGSGIIKVFKKHVKGIQNNLPVNPDKSCCNISRLLRPPYSPHFKNNKQSCYNKINYINGTAEIPKKYSFEEITAAYPTEREASENEDYKTVNPEDSLVLNYPKSKRKNEANIEINNHFLLKAKSKDPDIEIDGESYIILAGSEPALFFAACKCAEWAVDYDNAIFIITQVWQKCPGGTSERAVEAAYKKGYNFINSSIGIKILQQNKKLNDSDKKNAIKNILNSWYYIYKTENFVNSKYPIDTKTKNNFNAIFASITGTGNACNYVFTNDLIKHAAQLVYEPGEERILKDCIGQELINTWISPELEEIERTPEWFINHINYLFNKDDAEHILNWFAYIVQNPGKRVHHAILLIGKTGTGKSILYKVFQQILGKNNVASPHNENFQDKFTGWAKHCQLCWVNELNQKGEKNKLAEKLKPFITEPEIEIREMYNPPYTINNHMNLFTVSNEDLPILLDNDDRRWYIAKSEAKEKSEEYYNEMLKKIENQSGEVLYFLKNRDISKFNPGKRPQITEAKREIIQNSKTELEVLIEELIENEEGACANDIVSVAEITAELPLKMQNSAYVTKNRITKILKNMGGIYLPNQIRVGGRIERYWIIRNQEIWGRKEWEEVVQTVKTARGGAAEGGVFN